jgi:hypothetical protein
MVSRIHLTSVLEQQYACELEDLLFFHPHQGRFRRDIRASVEKYGSPKIVVKNNRLRVQLSLLEDVQTLYAIKVVGEELGLIGTVIYGRTEPKVIEILHIVVKEEYTYQGQHGSEGLTFFLIDELCRIASRIKGVSSVRLAYDKGRIIVKQFLEPIA